MKRDKNESKRLRFGAEPHRAGSRGLLAFGALALCFALGSIAISCSAQKMPQGKTALAEPGVEGRLQLGRGDTLVVQLPAQIGTGYVWKNTSLDRSHLAFIDEDLSEAGGGLGAAEVQRFRYLVLGAGKSAVEFHYLRPWEQEAPEQIYRVQVESSE